MGIVSMDKLLLIILFIAISYYPLCGIVGLIRYIRGEEYSGEAIAEQDEKEVKCDRNSESNDFTLTEEEKIICKMYLEDLDKTGSCNEYKLLMKLIESAKTSSAADHEDTEEEKNVICNEVKT